LHPLARQRSLNKLAAVTFSNGAPLRYSDSCLLPNDLSPPLVAVVLQSPGNADVAITLRECTILHRVGREFMERESQHLC
jgi:hypothetical protein